MPSDRRVVVALLVLIASGTVEAQKVTPAGVVARHPVDSAANHLTMQTLPRVNPGDSSRGHPKRWVAIGALAGGVAGGVITGTSVARTDDAFFAGPGILIGTTLGIATGAIVGGLAYLISHSN